MKPRFAHDCDKCRFVCQHEDADLYYCPKLGSVIARFSDEFWDYSSSELKYIRALADLDSSWMSKMKKEFPYYKVWEKLIENSDWRPNESLV